MDINRLNQLAQTVPKAKYQVGQIVELTPEEFDVFDAGTLGLILAVNAFNDADEPYIGYQVQIDDDPPSEYNDYFDGFNYERIEHIFEAQIIRMIA
ncbi:MAG: hypothetical protein AAF572_15845 [Cyanobacteria bacterium P01_B01_bin.77]